MKKQALFLMVTALLCGVVLTGAEAVKSLKILSIGNSFSISVTKELNAIAASDPTCTVVHENAYLGGCSMERHWNEHLKCEKDPSYKTYSRKKYSLRDLLAKEKWDIVTIQQASPLSWRKGSYEPFATNLINLVKEMVPGAEIVIQQTWSYNAIARQFNPQNKYCWKADGKPMDQNLMYDLLTDSYTELAKTHNLRIIPAGYAVQLYRKAMGSKLVSAEPADYQNSVHPNVPTTNDVVGSFSWRKANDSEQVTLRTDSIHLNRRGQYLQALVWYAALFGKDPEKITHKPAAVTDKEAALFKKCAQDAVANFKQVKK